MIEEALVHQAYHTESTIAKFAIIFNKKTNRKDEAFLGVTNSIKNSLQKHTQEILDKLSGIVSSLKNGT